MSVFVYIQIPPQSWLTWDSSLCSGSVNPSSPSQNQLESHIAPVRYYNCTIGNNIEVRIRGVATHHQYQVKKPDNNKRNEIKDNVNCSWSII